MPAKLPERVLQEAGWSAREELPRGPNGLPLCRWCQLEILSRRRRTFCSEYCVHQWRVRSDPGYLREQVLLRDRGFCSACGMDTQAAYGALKRSRGKAREEALAMLGTADGDGAAVAVGRGPHPACG